MSRVAILRCRVAFTAIEGGDVAVLVTDRQLVPATRGNRRRILGVLRGLRALGLRVVLISNGHSVDDELQHEIDLHVGVRARGFPGGPVRGFDSRPFQIAVERVTAAVEPTVVIAEYAWLAPAMRRLPRNVLRVVDCHDVLHQRTLRFRAAGLDPWTECTRREEQALLSFGDVLVASQERDAEILQALMPQSCVRTLLPSVDLPPRALAGSPASRDVLAVGAMHSGNDGIRVFATRVWPHIARASPGARLRVVGSIGEGMAPLPGVDWAGVVEDLDREYAVAAAVVCPIEVGTGVKIKLLEALRLGKAVVATPAAAEGLPAPGRPAWLSGDSVAGCAQPVVALLENADRRLLLESDAFAYGEAHLSFPRFVDDLASILSHAPVGAGAS